MDFLLHSNMNISPEPFSDNVEPTDIPVTDDFWDSENSDVDVHASRLIVHAHGVLSRKNGPEILLVAFTMDP
jgi:hypothetical protein